MEIFCPKTWIAKNNNPSNGRGIFILDGRPRVQKDIKEHAVSLGLITSTFNCNVQVFRKTTKGAFCSVVVISIKNVDDTKEVARPKKQQPLHTEGAAVIFS